MQKNDQPLQTRLKDLLPKDQIALVWSKVAGLKDDRPKRVYKKPSM